MQLLSPNQLLSPVSPSSPKSPDKNIQERNFYKR